MKRFFLLSILLIVLCVPRAQAVGQSISTPKAKPFAVSFTVTDASGRPVNDLKAEDFQLFDAGVPADILSFSKENLSVTYGLVLDHSGSLKERFREIVEAAKKLANGNEANDQTFIVAFVGHDQIELIHEMTTDKGSLVAAVDKLRTELGQTALIDAMYVATQYAMKRQLRPGERRPALVLISDGEDRASYYNETQLFELLHNSGLQVFPIVFVGDLDSDRGLIMRSTREKALKLVTRLASETSGETFILNSTKQLPDAIESVTRSLHSHYLVTYNTQKNPDKVKRNVQIKLKKTPEHDKWRLFLGDVGVAKDTQ